MVKGPEHAKLRQAEPHPVGCRASGWHYHSSVISACSRRSSARTKPGTDWFNAHRGKWLWTGFLSRIFLWTKHWVGQ